MVARQPYAVPGRTLRRHVHPGGFHGGRIVPGRALFPDVCDSLHHHDKPLVASGAERDGTELSERDRGLLGRAPAYLADGAPDARGGRALSKWLDGSFQRFATPASP